MRHRVTLGAFLVAGLAISLALAFFVSPEASSLPDGLDKVAADSGFAGEETDHALADSPTAGYEVKGIHNERLSTGLAGVAGVIVTFGFGYGLFALARRSRRADLAETP